MQPNISLSFHGIALTVPCRCCKGEGEVTPTPEQRSICPGCNQHVAPIDTTEADADAHNPGMLRGIARDKWLATNPIKCPECGQPGDYQDFGLQPIWCGECEGSGRELTEAGRELLVFIDAFRKRG